MNRNDERLTQWLFILSLAGLIFYVMHQYLYIGVVASHSMVPAFNKGDLIVAVRDLKLDYGDAVVFKSDGHYVLKRLIGKAGDQIEMIGKVRLRNGRPFFEPYVAETIDEGHRIFKVPPGGLMLLGDHREDSKDVRNTGEYVFERDVIGPVVFQIKGIKEKE